MNDLFDDYEVVFLIEKSPTSYKGRCIQKHFMLPEEAEDCYEHFRGWGSWTCFSKSIIKTFTDESGERQRKEIKSWNRSLR